ncbi:phage tail protein [Rhizobium sp. 2MFCol3.1]|uniref:phage tail protein n=1 Tax=Rhizobium sp. 2MFCol3.1 TaxID=1246459 RepID=UPI000371A62A|nr:phage tail protein [Rhizobium sp. 2MFCol3.1]
MGAQVRSFDRINAMGLLTNSANAYSLTYDVGPLAYEKGEFFSFFVNATNTGAATLNINGLGSRDIVQNDGSALKAGDLVAGMVFTATYDGSKFRIVNSTANASFGTVTATTGMTIGGKPVFNVDNDGAGSGLDSDKLDGQEGAWYQARANHTGTQDVATITGLQAVLDAIVPAGTVIHTAANAAPTGYFAADGSAKSRTTYARLFAAIGTTYGIGDGSTTFNVPDLRGEFIRGFDSGRGVDISRVFGSAQASQNLAHNHAITDPGHAHSVYDPGHVHGAQGYNFMVYTGGGGGQGTTGGGFGQVGSTSAAGTGIGIYAAGTNISIQNNGGTEARPRNIALLACIKY